MNSTQRAILLTGAVIVLTLGGGIAVTRLAGPPRDDGANGGRAIPGVPLASETPGPAPAPPGEAPARPGPEPDAARPAPPVADPDTDGHVELPLRKHGLGGAEELARALAQTEDARVKELFERGFRYIFTTRTELRHASLATTELKAAIEADAGFAPAYRALGEAVFVQRMDYAQAVAHYRKAIELREDYGEAHYGLASLHARSPREEDRAAGARHFRRARQLGIPDDLALARTYDAAR